MNSLVIKRNFNYQCYLDAEKKKSKTEARKLVVSDVFYSMKGLLQPPPHPWETAYLPLP